MNVSLMFVFSGDFFIGKWIITRHYNSKKPETFVPGSFERNPFNAA